MGHASVNKHFCVNILRFVKMYWNKNEICLFELLHQDNRKLNSDSTKQLNTGLVKMYKFSGLEKAMLT